MQTYSHFLVTAVLKRALKPQSAEDGMALLAGSAAPDLPLALLSLGYVVDRRYIRTHLPDKTRCSPTYNQLYFNNPWWIAAHNSLHAPLPLFALALLGLLLRQRWLLWFVLGAGLHTAVDIFSHADDGPVLLFPLDWQKRFQSPLSYWDPQYGGRTFRLLEHLLDGLLVAYLLYKRTKACRK